MGSVHTFPRESSSVRNIARSSLVITLSDPRPLLDPGGYQAVCVEATFAWARHWKKWVVRLVMEPVNYAGRSYSGRLCKFLFLGTNPDKPYAGPLSDFRRLYVELNGGQPTGPEVTMRIFENRLYDVTVETVKLDRNGKQRAPEHWYSIVREIHPAAAPTRQHSNTSSPNSSTQRTQTTHSTDQHSNTENTPQTEKRLQSAIPVFSEATVRR